MNSWDILGIAPTSDKRAIKKAYSKLLARYHPEEHPEKFEEINKAYNMALFDANYVDLYPDDEYGFDEAEQAELNDYETEPADETISPPLTTYVPFEPYTPQIYFDTHGADNSVFRTDEAYEESLRQEQEQMFAVLDRFDYLLSLKDNARTDLGKRRKTELLNLIRKQFKQFKNNSTFIYNLSSSLYRGESINVKHIVAIKKVFGIYNKMMPITHDRNLDNAIYQLNATLSSISTAKPKYFDAKLIIAICVILAILFTQTDILSPPSPPTGQAAAPIAVSPTVLHWMATEYRLGNGREQSYSEAARLYRIAAEQGYAPSLFNLGLMYAHGIEVEQSYGQAAVLFIRAANQEHANAQFSLALLYDHGHGVSQSYEQAAYWYRKAAEQGNLPAKNNLGVLYRGSPNFAQDNEQSVYWFRKAANNGFPYAQLNLGEMYEAGHGVAQSLETAIYWYEKAANQSNIQAEIALNRLLPQH